MDLFRQDINPSKHPVDMLGAAFRGVRMERWFAVHWAELLVRADEQIRQKRFFEQIRARRLVGMEQERQALKKSGVTEKRARDVPIISFRGRVTRVHSHPVGWYQLVIRVDYQNTPEWGPRSENFMVMLTPEHHLFESFSVKVDDWVSVSGQCFTHRWGVRDRDSIITCVDPTLTVSRRFHGPGLMSDRTRTPAPPEQKDI